MQLRLVRIVLGIGSLLIGGVIFLSVFLMKIGVFPLTLSSTLQFLAVLVGLIYVLAGILHLAPKRTPTANHGIE